MNLTARLREVARLRPDAPAVVAGQSIENVPAGRVFTYEAFDRILDAIAIRALNWGLHPDEHVSLALRPHFPMLALRLGLARAGIATSSGEGGTGASVRIAMRDAPSPSGERVVVVDPEWWTVPARARPAPMHPGGDVAFALQPTSGTSGAPKSVPITHAQIAMRMRAQDTVPHPPDARVLCTSGPSGGFGLVHALRAFDAGGTVVVATVADDVAGLIARHRVNTLAASPYAVGRLIDSLPPGAPRPPSLAQVNLSGAPITAALARIVAERVCESVLCTYGSTEVGPIAIGYARDMRGIDGATGFLLPTAAAEALDADGRPLPRGHMGPLRMRSPAMGSEYYRNPEATARTFRDGWCYPGDVGMVTDDGILVIAGRNDDLINVGGSKIAPETIERLLMLVPGVTDAAAFGVPDGLGRQVVHAAIVVDRDVEVDALQQVFRSHVGTPPPSVVLRVPQLPRDESGKLRRDALVHFVQSMPRRRVP